MPLFFNFWPSNDFRQYLLGYRKILLSCNLFVNSTLIKQIKRRDFSCKITLQLGFKKMGQHNGPFNQKKKNTNYFSSALLEQSWIYYQNKFKVGVCWSKHILGTCEHKIIILISNLLVLQLLLNPFPSTLLCY